MITHEDIKSLKKLSGIGPKAAGQIILDLKGSLKLSSLDIISPTKKLTNFSIVVSFKAVIAVFGPIPLTEINLVKTSLLSKSLKPTRS